MSNQPRQRQVRFSPDLDALIQERADAAGISVPAWMKSVIQQALDNAGQDALRNDLRAARSEQTEQLDRLSSELKGFVVEALMGLGERLTAQQEAFLLQLIGQLPQAPSGPRRDELFPSSPPLTGATQ